MSDINLNAEHAVKLCNSNDSIVLSILEWEAICLLAQCYGWQRQGTILDLITLEKKQYFRQRPEAELIECARQMQAWDGSYMEPDNQIVQQSDAISLTHHLMLAVACDALPLGVQRSVSVLNEQAIPKELQADLDIDDLRQRAAKSMIKRFIAFAKQGSFRITRP